MAISLNLLELDKLSKFNTDNTNNEGFTNVATLSFHNEGHNNKPETPNHKRAERHLKIHNNHV